VGYLKCQAAIDFGLQSLFRIRSLAGMSTPNQPTCQIESWRLLLRRAGRTRIDPCGCFVQEDAFRNVAIEAARAAGAVLQQWSQRFTVQEKGPANLVTEADFASQEVIVSVIQSRFPDHGFLGEEGLDRAPSGQHFRWIIDPLDGTGNYVHGFPYFAVSIGLEHKGEMVVGAIYDPTRDEMFVAQKGQGAWLNESPIRPSSVAGLEKAFVVASLPSAIDASHPSVARMLRVLPRAQTLQRTGSAALNLAYVACGRIDAFWSTSMKPWDVAAGGLIVVEAGGALTTTGGRLFDLYIADLLASNGSAVHSQLVDLLTGPVAS